MVMAFGLTTFDSKINSEYWVIFFCLGPDLWISPLHQVYELTILSDDSHEQNGSADKIPASYKNYFILT